jgi:hypothetical protein
MHLVLEYCRNVSVFPVHPIRYHMISLCSVIDDVNFNHLTKVVDAKFLHYKVYLFFFAMNKYFCGKLP